TKTSGKRRKYTPGGGSALAEELLEPRAAFRGSFVQRGQLGEGLGMARLRLYGLAVHGLGAALELAGAIQVTEGHVRIGVVGALLHDALEQLLGPTAPVRVLHVGAGEQHLGPDPHVALQPRNGRLEELDGVPVLLLLEG